MSEDTAPEVGEIDLRASNPEEVDGASAVDTELERRRAVAQRCDGARETRRFALADMELRDTSDGMVRFTGYASITEHPYEVGDWVETVARGAFRRSLAEDPDVSFLVNHQGLPLARTKSGSMTLAEDARGLRVDADLNPDDPDVKALLPKMRRGDVSEMSFAFRVNDQQWSEDFRTRLLRSVGIHKGDVSVVTYGANDATTASIIARSADGLLEVRAGKEISDANRAKIQNALDLSEDADRALDKIQPILADVLSVPNPDEDESGEGEMPPMRAIVLPDHTSIARAEFDLLVARSKS